LPLLLNEYQDESWHILKRYDRDYFEYKFDKQLVTPKLTSIISVTYNYYKNAPKQSMSLAYILDELYFD